MSRRADYDRYIAASVAAREMQARLIAVADDLAKVDFKVASAVIVFTSSFSKVWDHVSREQIAEAAGCHPQVAGRSLTKLHRLGVLTWEPSTHAGGQSRLSLLSPDTTVVSGEVPEDLSPDTTVVSSPDTAAVSLPRSSSEKKEGEDPLPPSAGNDWIGPLLREHWGGKGRITQRHVQAVQRMIGAGWTREQVEHIVTANLESAESIGALRTRLNRIVDGTRVQFYDEAMRDKTMQGYLTPGRPERGHRVSSIARRDGEFGAPIGYAGPVDFDTGEPRPGNPWTQSLGHDEEAG